MRQLPFTYRLISFLSVGLLLAVLSIGTRDSLAAQEKPRIALVIGNAAYKDSPLANPVNDATDVAAMLRKLGFDVIERTNATQKEMNRAISQFGSKLTTDTMGLFYFAGHGLQVRGKNYLVPVDAEISTENSIRAETVDVDAVLDQLSVSDLNVVILDACRNNPFERKFRSMAGGGLAQMDAPKGSLIAYATSPGKTALDGKGRNGVFTQELLKQMAIPGQPVEAVFKNVRRTVARVTGDQQIPWESSSLTGDFYFNSAKVSVPAAPAGEPATGTGTGIAQKPEDAAWRIAILTDTPEAYRGFLVKYPGSRYEATAAALIAAKEPAEEEEEDPPSLPAAGKSDGKSIAAAPPVASRPAGAMPVPAPTNAGAGESALVPSASPQAQGKSLPTTPQAAPPVPVSEPAVPTNQTVMHADRSLIGKFVIDPSGEPSGEGRIVWKNGANYVGSIVSGKRHGKGTYTTGKGLKVEGEWKSDVVTAPASVSFPTGERYVGEVRGDMPHGQGRMTWPDGNFWDGRFADGQQVNTGQMEVRLGAQTLKGELNYDPDTQTFTGNASMAWNNGDRFEGQIIKGVKQGRGTFVWANGQRYEGEWRNDQPNGRGVIVNLLGDRYEGEVRDGVPHGQGQYAWKDGGRYEGVWVAGKRNGLGRTIEANGTVREERYVNDELQ